MAQILIITGAAIFGLLGSLHLLYTFFTNKFNPYDITVKAAMQKTSFVLTKETTVWNAWIGFNASHSLGAILMAAFYIPLTLSHFTLIENSLWFSSLPVMISFSYLCLAKKYWFKIPFTGLLISTLCFMAAATMITIDRL